MKKIIAISVLSFAFTPSFAEEINKSSLLDKLEIVINKIAETRSNDEAPIRIETTPVEIKPTIEVKELPEIEEKVIAEKKEEAIKEEIKQETQSSIKEETQEEQIKSEETPKKYIKKVAKKKKTVKESEIILSNKAILLETDYHSIPENLTKEQEAKLEEKLSYDKIKYSFNKIDNELGITLIDPRLFIPLHPMNIVGDFSAFSVSTDLNKVKNTKINYVQNQNMVKLNDHDTCQAVFFTYKLKAESLPKTIVQYIDSNGNIVDKLSEKCFKDIEENIGTTFYTDSNYIINIGYNNNLTNKKTLAMTLHFTKEGKQFNPSNLQVIAINKDFSTAYSLTPKVDSRNPYYGINISKNIPEGNYHILIGYDGIKYEWIKSNISIK